MRKSGNVKKYECGVCAVLKSDSWVNFCDFRFLKYLKFPGIVSKLLVLCMGFSVLLWDLGRICRFLGANFCR